MLPEFSILLKALISKRFSSQREFVRHAYSGDEGSGSAYVSKVLKGQKPPPMDRLPAWADALELYGDERQPFLDLAAIAHLPVEVQPRFVSLLRQAKSLQADKDSNNLAIDRLQADVDQIKISLASAERGLNGPSQSK